MILNIAFYRFVPLSDLPELRATLKSAASELGLKGSILLAPEGINGFLAGAEASVRRYVGFLENHPALASENHGPLDIKESWSEAQPFARLKVKLKREIITMGYPAIQPALSTGERLAPETLKEWLDDGKPVLLVDTRNDYELKEGGFQGAMDLKMKSFRDFPNRLDQIKAEAQGRPVVMFCTGGIRCEKATAIAADQGIPNVYQLEGGILRYFEKVGQSHYDGRCFVFDERVALDAELKAL